MAHVLFKLVFLCLSIIHTVYADINVGVLSLRRLPPIYWNSYVNGSITTITMKGPSTTWFGIGINGTEMADTYAFIVFPDGNVTEWILGDHHQGQLLPSRHTVTFTEIVDGIRTIELERSRIGYSNLYYTFPNYREEDVGIITAWGEHENDPLEFHGFDNKASNTMVFSFSNETTLDPTNAPSIAPTNAPSLAPTNAPVLAPTNAPTTPPTPAPTVVFESRYDLEGSTILGGSELNNIELTIGIETDSKTAFITMTGPTAQWFAIGFGSPTMRDTYSIIILWQQEENIDIDDDIIIERYLGNHDEGDELDEFIIKQQQPEVDEFRRSVLMERPTANSDATNGFKYFNFSSNCNREYKLIWARGEYSTIDTKGVFAQHSTNDMGSGTIRVEQEGLPNCNWTQSMFNKMSLYLIIVLSFIVVIVTY